jgi:hypothetical protein
MSAKHVQISHRQVMILLVDLHNNQRLYGAGSRADYERTGMPLTAVARDGE